MTRYNRYPDVKREPGSLLGVSFTSDRMLLDINPGLPPPGCEMISVYCDPGIG